MSQKSETTALVLALLITLMFLAGGLWWSSRRQTSSLGRLFEPQANPSGTNPSSQQPTSQSATGSSSQTAGFAQVNNVPAGLFSYGGSTSWAPLRLSVDSAIQAARPEFRLRYVEPASGTPGSTTGIAMLLSDRLTFAQSSRPLTEPEYNQAQQRGFSLKQIPVAIDGLAIAVNPNLQIPGLTIDQLQGIYRGRITNWSQVGGPNLAIRPYSRPITAGGTVELFVEEILQGAPLGQNVEFVPTTTAAIRKLSGNLGGIYYASAPEIVPQCTVKPLPIGRRSGEFVAPYQQPYIPSTQCPAQRNQLNTVGFQQGEYPITRNLFVIVKQNGRVDEQAGEAYANFLLTEEGQNAIAKAGFVKIR